mgnify:FL=1
MNRAVFLYVFTSVKECNVHGGMRAILGGLLQLRRVRGRQGGREATKKRGMVSLMHLAPLLFDIMFISVNLRFSCLGLENTVVSKLHAHYVARHAGDLGANLERATHPTPESDD